MKICIICKKEKLFIDFTKNKNHKDGYGSYCKECNKNRVKEYYKQNKELRLKYIIQYNNEHKQEKADYDRKYRKKNKEKRLKHKREYRDRYNKLRREKYRSDYLYKLTILIRGLLLRSLKVKYNKTFDLLGYNSIDLSNYLDVKDIKDLQDKHIDHIIPSSLYKNKKELIKKGFSLRNLRLLNAKENIIKNNKLDFELINKYKIIDLLPKGII